MFRFSATSVSAGKGFKKLTHTYGDIIWRNDKIGTITSLEDRKVSADQPPSPMGQLLKGWGIRIGIA